MDAANAERYYRTMVRADQQSWNIRNVHMSDTIDRIADPHGNSYKSLVWAQNTHVGDARATNMAVSDTVNLGQEMRQRHPGSVLLAEFTSHAGSVLAATGRGSPEEDMPVPPARPDSHEDLLNDALGQASVLVFGDKRPGPWLAPRHGHRAIGVLQDPYREWGNFVPRWAAATTHTCGSPTRPGSSPPL